MSVPASLKRRFLRPLGARLLVARPDPTQYGHLALEILMAMTEARATSRRLVLLRAQRVVNAALFELEAEGVDQWRPGPVVRAALLVWWHAAAARERLLARVREDIRRRRHDVAREFGRRSEDLTLAPEVRHVLRRWKVRWSAPPVPARTRIGRPYLRRRDVRSAVKVRLTARAETVARRAAERVGIPHDARLVTIHAREAGFKAGREVHDDRRKPPPRYDDLRNARIETYFAAVDRLVRDGYTVVRVGDPTMTPVARPGVIDLATHPSRAAVLDLWCLLRSEFAIMSESGPAQVALLTDTPTLTVNATDPISSFPIRSHSMFLLKQVVELPSGRVLGWRELLGPEYLGHLRDPARYGYLDNTPAEIAAAVAEMQELLTAGPPERSEQAEFRACAARAAAEYRDRLRYVRKFGADEGFFGDGRIAREYVGAVV